MALMVMTGDEFAKHILEGERDLSRVQLDNFDLKSHDSFPAIQDYLQATTDLDCHPITTDDASFRYLRAEGLWLPFLQGRRLDLRGADLRGADLWRANLEGAELRGVQFKGVYLARANLQGAALRRADLSGANLEEANIGRADLSGANLEGANLRETYLVEANLEGASLLRVGNLQHAIGITMATYHETRLDTTAKDTILSSWRSEMEQWFTIVE